MNRKALWILSCVCLAAPFVAHSSATANACRATNTIAPTKYAGAKSGISANVQSTASSRS